MGQRQIRDTYRYVKFPYNKVEILLHAFWYNYNTERIQKILDTQIMNYWNKHFVFLTNLQWYTNCKQKKMLCFFFHLFTPKSVLLFWIAFIGLFSVSEMTIFDAPNLNRHFLRRLGRGTFFNVGAYLIYYKV